MGEIPAPFSLRVTRLVREVKIAEGEAFHFCYRSCEQLIRGCSYIESPLEPHKTPCGCTYSCNHRHISLRTDISETFLRSLKFEICRPLHCHFRTPIITCLEQAFTELQDIFCAVMWKIWKSDIYNHMNMIYGGAILSCPKKCSHILFGAFLSKPTSFF